MHICPELDATLELRNEEAILRLEDERRLEKGIEDGLWLAILELDLELGARLELAGATLDVTEQTAPDMTGTCALLPPLLPCTPNSMLEPTGIALFQFNGTAV